jgi:hypothetical protein
MKGEKWMAKIIAAIFKERDDAECAAQKVVDRGFDAKEISIIRKGSQTDGDGESSSDSGGGSGAMEGGVIGGAIGLLLGMGAIAVPGLGVFAAAGPLAGILSGALAGGVIGALVDIGIPEENSREYESEIKIGRILWSLSVDDDKPIDDIVSDLKECGATTVNIH